MATLGDAVDEVLDRMGAGRPSNTRLVEKVSRQIKRDFKTLCGRRDWSWKQAKTTIAVTATDTTIALPTVVRSGKTISRVHRVLFCVTASNGRCLEHRPELTDLVARGTSLDLFGRGEPAYWCVTSDDTDGAKKLLLMPLPGYAETLHIWYTRSAASMVPEALTDTFPFDEEYEGYVIERAVAALSASDATMDPNVSRTAFAQANEIFRAMCHTERKASPPIQAVQWLGHGVFGG